MSVSVLQPSSIFLFFLICTLQISFARHLILLHKTIIREIKKWDFILINPLSAQSKFMLKWEWLGHFKIYVSYLIEMAYILGASCCDVPLTNQMHNLGHWNPRLRKTFLLYIVSHKKSIYIYTCFCLLIWNSHSTCDFYLLVPSCVLIWNSHGTSDIWLLVPS